MHYCGMTPQASRKPLNPFAPNFTPRNAPPPPPPPPPLPVYLVQLPAAFFFTYTVCSSSSFYTHYSTAQQQQNPLPTVPPPPQQQQHKEPRVTGSKCTKGMIIPPKNSTRSNLKELRRRNKHRVLPLKWDDEDNTTIMIKNIPYDCPRKVLITLLDKFCLLENDKAKNEEEEGVAYCAYDFVYLPIDFRSGKGRGFAFVNFTNARAVRKFFDAFHHTRLYYVPRQKWSKDIEIVSAKLQGKDALVSHFRGSMFECKTDEFLPAVFSPPRDGSGQPVELTVVGKRLAPQLPDRPAT